jgi:ATP-dependent exoDNAse (exonuclease V) alpha subunit
MRLRDGRTLQVPLDYVEAGHLTHGYAATIHKSQGVTCDRLLVLGDDTFTIELAYTSLTRGRLSNQLYLVAPDGVDALEHSQGLQPDADPIASFAARLHRSGAKTAAIDHLQPEPIGVEL